VTLDDAAALIARGGSIRIRVQEASGGNVKFGSTNLLRMAINATTPNHRGHRTN